jgi:hypothetical protein
MKLTAFFALLVFTGVSFANDRILFQPENGKLVIKYTNRTITADAMFSVLKASSDPEVVKLAKSYQGLSLTGAIFGGVGGGLIGGAIGGNISTKLSTGKPMDPVLYQSFIWSGIGLAIAGQIFSINANKKLLLAIEKFNSTASIGSAYKHNSNQIQYSISRNIYF